ncbi:MAG: tRNA (adenosine(37)-N6)-threonylcarbamoyltransferase complex transferase subunit TsaD [Beijerinckiaceae bacterium]
MLVLGIETTCDETGVGVVRMGQDGRGDILADEIYSQTVEHQPFGGVVPEIAARAHIERLDPMIAAALAKANVRLDQLSGIAAAAGPGLVGGVIVGLTAAKALALVAKKPFIAVNHLEAHALTPRLVEAMAFPYLLLLVSGGHTQLLAVKGVGQYVRLGTTIDDAIGEAFDKVAKLLGLPYPGGPAVEDWAAKGNPDRIPLPRPMIGRARPDFSLSGLKTAVRNEAVRLSPLTPQDVADLCAAFQSAVVDLIIDRTRVALRSFHDSVGESPRALVIAGGVGANIAIRRALTRLAGEVGLRIVIPPPKLCTDNGAMIAWAGIERLNHGLTDGFDTAPRPRWPLDTVSPPVYGSGRLGQKA